MNIGSNLVTIVHSASCARGATCGWWTSDVILSPLFIAGFFLGVIVLILLANILRSRSRD